MANVTTSALLRQSSGLPVTTRRHIANRMEGSLNGFHLSGIFLGLAKTILFVLLSAWLLAYLPTSLPGCLPSLSVQTPVTVLF